METIRKLKEKEVRPSWEEYLIQIARLVGTRSTCLRRKVGAILVKDKRILSTGYNGAPRKLAHCAEIGCLRDKLKIPSGERQEICRGLHAEQNAIIQAALYGISIKGAVLYCTHQPCVTCAKMLMNAGIKKIIFQGEYPDGLAREMLEEGEIELIKLPPHPSLSPVGRGLSRGEKGNSYTMNLADGS